MSKLIIMPEVEDIRLFQSGGQDRATNDESNKIREEILASILHVDDEYLNHPEFGVLWTSIREKFLSTISSLCTDEPFKKIVIKQTGGMKYNYDFLVTFLGQLNEKTNTRSLVKEVKLETEEYKYSFRKSKSPTRKTKSPQTRKSKKSKKSPTLHKSKKTL